MVNKPKFYICSIVVLLLGATLATSDLQNEFEAGRSLATCSSYTDCSTCNSETNCNYLDGSCEYYDETGLRYQSVSTYTASQYCHNAINGGYIYLSEHDYDIDFYAYSNASTSTYPYCEWRVLASRDTNIKITISKNSGQLEDFYMYSNSYNGQNYYYSKDFANCGGGEIEFEFEQTGYFRIKAEILNDNSNYFIKVREGDAEEEDLTAFILIIAFGSLVVVLAILGLIWMIYCIIKRDIRERRRIRARQQPLPEQLAKVEFINRCLDSMKSGKYSELDIPYDQDSCIVCLEEFTPESEVNITNECSHVFHWKCLNSWFRNIRCDKDLTCPHCTGLITDGEVGDGAIGKSVAAEDLEISDDVEGPIATGNRILNNNDFEIEIPTPQNENEA